MADNKYFDPRLPLPPIEDAKYADIRLTGAGGSEAPETLTPPPPSNLPIPGTDPSTSGLRPPDSVTIVAQKVRTALDGTQLIDLVLEIGEVPGATDYEVRVTKL
jgi:hypothetical protein